MLGKGRFIDMLSIKYHLDVIGLSLFSCMSWQKQCLLLPLVYNTLANTASKVSSILFTCDDVCLRVNVSLLQLEVKISNSSLELESSSSDVRNLHFM